MFTSLSEAKINTFKGVVYGRSHPNNLRNTLWFNTNVDSLNVAHKVKLNSPMVAKIDVLKYGSNKNRKKLSHIPALDLSPTRILDPIIHGKGYKPRSACYTGKKRRKVDRMASEDGGDGKKDDKSVKKLVLSELDDQAMKRKNMKLDQADSYK